MDQSRKKEGFSWVLRRALRLIVLAIAGLVLLPYLITPLYSVVDPISTTMLSRRLSGLRVERQFVPITRISPALPLVVIIAEDGRFCIHRGIDLTEIREAIAEADDIEEIKNICTCGKKATMNIRVDEKGERIREGEQISIGGNEAYRQACGRCFYTG